jgi:hypothetical protein
MRNLSIIKLMLIVLAGFAGAWALSNQAMLFKTPNPYKAIEDAHAIYRSDEFPYRKRAAAFEQLLFQIDRGRLDGLPLAENQVRPWLGKPDYHRQAWLNGYTRTYLYNFSGVHGPSSAIVSYDAAGRLTFIGYNSASAFNPAEWAPFPPSVAPATSQTTVTNPSRPPPQHTPLSEPQRRPGSSVE